MYLVLCCWCHTTLYSQFNQTKQLVAAITQQEHNILPIYEIIHLHIRLRAIGNGCEPTEIQVKLRDFVGSNDGIDCDMNIKGRVYRKVDSPTLLYIIAGRRRM